MKILGREISNEVADAIVAKARLEERFKEYLRDMKREFRFLESDKRIHRAIEFVNEYHPGCKFVFEIMYDADGSFEMEYSSTCVDENGVATIGVAYDGMCSMRLNQDKLFDHIAKTYKIQLADYHPRVYPKERAFEFEFKPSPRLKDLITDINERVPEVKVKRMNGNVIRIQMK